jgi:hypothetical protein
MGITLSQGKPPPPSPARPADASGRRCVSAGPVTATAVARPPQLERGLSGAQCGVVAMKSLTSATSRRGLSLCTE